MNDFFQMFEKINVLENKENENLQWIVNKCKEIEVKISELNKQVREEDCDQIQINKEINNLEKEKKVLEQEVNYLRVEHSKRQKELSQNLYSMYVEKEKYLTKAIADKVREAKYNYLNHLLAFHCINNEIMQAYEKLSIHFSERELPLPPKPSHHRNEFGVYRGTKNSLMVFDTEILNAYYHGEVHPAIMEYAKQEKKTIQEIIENNQSS